MVSFSAPISCGLLVILFIPATIEAQGNLLRELEAELANIVQRARPSVVTISARQFRQSDETLIPAEEKVSWQRNIGSGVIFDQEGHIVTTTHVVDQATDIFVSFISGEEVPAQFIGSDRESQVAVIKVDQKNITGAKLSDSNHLQVNHWAVILGNCSGLFPSASFGLICGWRDESGLFQIAASSTPGISGAPVFNTSGEVVGIIVFAIAEGGAILSMPPGTTGASLAVPINRVKMVVQSLIRQGYVEYGWLGVVFATNTFETSGVQIVQVLEEGPARLAGLQSGDLVLRYGNVPVRGAYQLKEMVRSTLPGTLVPIRVRRNGRQTTCSVRVGGRRPYEIVVQDPTKRDRLGDPPASTSGDTSTFPGKWVRMFNASREMR